MQGEVLGVERPGRRVLRRWQPLSGAAREIRARRHTGRRGTLGQRVRPGNIGPEQASAMALSAADSLGLAQIARSIGFAALAQSKLAAADGRCPARARATTATRRINDT